MTTITKIDGQKLAAMLIEGANNLANHVKTVDALNVFPVPDGDTGTNMNLSITSGVKEVKGQSTNHVGTVATAFANGLLMGSRGNSGVILSQLFRGFSKEIEAYETIDAKQFAKAFEHGYKTAYRDTMRPVEGTILTVAKDAAKHGIEIVKKQDNIIAVMEEIVKAANASLQRTPDLLPILKEVGVVDSGGQGLVFIYEGLLAAIKGERLPDVEQNPSIEDLIKVEHHQAQRQLATEDIVYGYCTEFMVRLEEEKLEKNPFDVNKFRNDLSEYGDSLLVISEQNLAKVHIHAEEPGKVLAEGQQYGSLINIKIENMREQHTNLLEKPVTTESTEMRIVEDATEKSPYAIVAVSMGSGIASIFKGSGAKLVIEGGQTMNPSTEGIVKAIKEANAKDVYLLPNNSNIIMAAEQAAKVVEENVIIIPSKTVPQGLAALLAFNPGSASSENEEAMNEAMKHVKTGQVTFAVRNTTIDGIEIKEGDFMGILEKSIVSSGESLQVVSEELVTKILDDDSEIITIIQGEGVNEEQTNLLVSYIEENYEDVEIDVQIGNQPLYPYIFSVE